MAEIVGELFDQSQAQKIKGEIEARNISVTLNKVSTQNGDVFQLYCEGSDDVEAAREYFRVRMGLGGGKRFEVDPEWKEIQATPLGKMTFFLIGISVGIYLLSFNEAWFASITELFFFNAPEADRFESLASGQWWRLITPIFLHFNLLHILFNCMWMKDLGSVLERDLSLVRFSLLILALAIFSNSLQYALMGERFGGLSGVIYGLLGYMWSRSMLSDYKTLSLPKRDIMLMVGWYFLCLTGLIGPIANVAHGAGLGLGMLAALRMSDQKLKTQIKVTLFAIFFSFGTYLIEILKINFL